MGVARTRAKVSSRYADPLQCAQYDNEAQPDPADHTLSSTLRITPTISAGSPDLDPYRIIPAEHMGRFAPPRCSDHGRVFRHSFWATARERTRRALVDAGMGLSRRYAFQECGGAPMVYLDKSTGDAKVVAHTCRDRWCRACGRTRRLKLVKNLTRLLPLDRTVHIVLTPVSTSDNLRDCVDRLYANAAKFRRSKWWKERGRGGVQIFETTWNPDLKMWHPHLHLLVHASWMQLQELSEGWHKVTGDSHRVNISLVENNASAITEVSKYQGKLAHRSWENLHERMVEAIKALHGRRLVVTFGTWKPEKLTDDKEPPVLATWICWGSLDALYALAKTGDAAANEILGVLHGRRPTPATPTPPGERDPP